MKVTFSRRETADSIGLLQTEQNGLIYILGKAGWVDYDREIRHARHEVRAMAFTEKQKADDRRDRRIEARSKRIQIARLLCPDETVNECQFYVGEMVDGDTAHTEQSPCALRGELADIRLESVRVWADSAEQRHHGWF